jgi:hypothetical protein
MTSTSFNRVPQNAPGRAVSGIVSPYISSNEVGDLYERAGQRRPVSALTGLWYFPGIFLFFIGPLVWFIKTNGALNAYWRARGAV